MLLPALAGARNKSKDISCRNQLKQIGFLMINYNHDYQDWYPIRPDPTGRPNACWTRLLAGLYLNAPFNAADGYLGGGITAFHCPSGIIDPTYAKRTRGYAMNGYAGNVFGVGAYETLLSDVNATSRPYQKNAMMMLVADYWNETTQRETWAFGSTNNGEYLSTAHGRRIAKRHGDWSYNYLVKNGAVLQTRCQRGLDTHLGFDPIWYYVHNGYYAGGSKFPF